MKASSQIGRVNSMASEYWCKRRLDSFKTPWRIAFGQRSNGKTFEIKVNGLLHFLETGKKFMYIRRQESEIKFSDMQRMFDDIWNAKDPETGAELNIKEHIKAKYPGYEEYYIDAWRGMFYICGLTINGDTRKIADFACYKAISTATKFKGTPFPDYDMMVFDEFMTPGLELPNELSQLLNAVSTVRRHRTDFVVYLLGNTVSRNNQILEGMGIDIRKLKRGEITVFEYHNSEGQVDNRVAVEWCETVERTTEQNGIYNFANGTTKMITEGEWETDLYPNFIEDEFYRNLPKQGVIFEGGQYKLFGYCMPNGELWVSDRRLITHINYLTLTIGETHADRKVFNWNCEYPRVQALKKVILFKIQNGKVRFRDNLVGDDFGKFIVRANKTRGKINLAS